MTWRDIYLETQAKEKQEIDGMVEEGMALLENLTVRLLTETIDKGLDAVPEVATIKPNKDFSDVVTFNSIEFLKQTQIMGIFSQLFSLKVGILENYLQDMKAVLQRMGYIKDSVLILVTAEWTERIRVCKTIGDVFRWYLEGTTQDEETFFNNLSVVNRAFFIATIEEILVEDYICLPFNEFYYGLYMDAHNAKPAITAKIAELKSKIGET